MERILVVEDSEEEQELIRRAIRDDFDLVFASNAREARARLAVESPDLILMDSSLPDSPGIELCTELRGDPAIADTPIVFLTACHDTSNKIMAFALGADDYVEKPFVPAELRARLAARIRRAQRSERGLLSFPDLRIDRLRRETWVRMPEGERRADLTPHEFGILVCLAASRGQPVSRTRLVEAAWGPIALSERTIDTHVSNLRRKIAPHGDRIRAERGVGYVLADPLVARD